MVGGHIVEYLGCLIEHELEVGCRVVVGVQIDHVPERLLVLIGRLNKKASFHNYKLSRRERLKSAPHLRLKNCSF